MRDRRVTAAVDEMGRMIGRRHFAFAAAGALLAAPFAARAQRNVAPVIGFLGSTTPELFAPLVDAFHHGLRDEGFVAGQNVAIEYRWAEGRYERLPALAGELVALNVKAIVAAGGSAPALAAKTATTTIPIVFSGVGDPLREGLVASLSRPGGNVTGFSAISSELDVKRLELLHEIAPAGRIIGVLMNPDNPDYAGRARDVQAAAQVLGRGLVLATPRSEREFEVAFATLVEQRASAILVGADAFFTSQRERIVALAARHALPGIYQWREFALAGGLMSYGTSITAAYRQTGVYVGRILKGARAADLPVQQLPNFELVINLRTAKALGLTVPESLLVRADEVIE